MTSAPARKILIVLMDVLIALAVAVTARLIVAFFGVLASQGWGELVLSVTKPLTIPFGIGAIKTPYGGVFEVNAALTIAAYLVAEWALSIARGRE